MGVEHGGNVFALAKELGYERSECLDFSANINPLGISPKLKAGLLADWDLLTHYPDVHYTKSRQRLAAHHGLTAESVVLANGAVELFYDIARALKPQKVLLLRPTFLEYEQAFSQVGAEVVPLVLTTSTYKWALTDILPLLDDLAVGDVVLLCNPNNPTGSLVTNRLLRDLAQQLMARELHLVLDEAFADFLVNEDDYSFVPYLKAFPNVIVVRSLTKFYAIPGLRLGYALTVNQAYVQAIEEVRPPWTVNALAEVALDLILEDKVYQEKTRQLIQTEKIFLYNALSAFHSIEVVKPSVNYIFFTYHGDLDLRSILRQRKIFIRSCANYPGLTDQHYRVAVRGRSDNEHLLAVLSDILEREQSP